MNAKTKAILMLTMALLVMWLCPLCVFADQQET